MTNPVMDRLTKNWDKGTAGDGSFAGSQQGHAIPSFPQTSSDEWNEGRFESSFQAPSADSVDRGVMTYDDVIVKTGLLFAALVVAAGVSWTLTASNMALAGAMAFIGGFGGFILAMVNIFSRKVRPSLIIAYAVAEGLVLGAISCLMEMTAYKGIVIQAVLATLSVFLVTLALFASGRIRNSAKLSRVTMISLVSVLMFSFVMWILGMTGVIPPGGSSMRIMGIPLGAIVALACVIIGAMCLVQDFDQAQQGVRTGVPSIFAWQCAFGMMVTIVWMYIEVLRLLSYLRDE